MLEGATLWELLDKRVDETPDDLLAVDESGREITFAQFKDRSERAAAGLVELGIGAGDTVTWQLPTWIESMVLVAAISRIGASQNPILHIFREREVGFCAKQTGAKLLVVPTTFGGFDFAGMAQGIVADLKAGGQDIEILTVDRTLPEGDPSTLAPPPAAGEGEQVRWYFYTSGTTADPKGAQHTDRTIHAVAQGMSKHLRVVPGDVNALAFPFPHIGGITWLFTSLQTGMRQVLFEAFVPDVVVKILGEQGVTLAGSGTVFHQVYLAAQRASDTPIFPEVRGFPGGGAPKPPALHYEMKEAFPTSAGILTGYGLTEAPVMTMATPDDSDEDLANTEGSPMPGVEIRIVTLEGKDAAQGEEGEVRVKAPQLMKGYLDESLNADAFDDQGFFRTGDLGSLTPNNMLLITGRLKDVIIRKGENISAKEVEDHLYEHPKVADVAVIGLPDANSGERVCAVVSTAADAEPLGYEEMVGFLKGEGLMMIKIPEQLEVVAAIPRNPAGKILKRDLQKQYEGSEPTRKA